MLPIKLKMQAFASYAEAVEIDFEKLDRLFLICGETGAGKTAVLDAMMYALYGESSGGDRSEMRCALPAAEKLPTEVEFTFTAHGKPYTFTRSITVTPRSKKLEFHQDCFYYDEERNRRAFFENPRQTFVRAKAEELTGLSAEQFRQVVILPQGKFERLLTSDSKDKETILSTLFGAEKYTRLSEKLWEKAEEKRKNLAAENAALKALLAAENAENPEQLAEERDRLKEETEALAPKLAEVKERLGAAREKLAAAEVLSAKFSERGAAEKRIADLGQRAEEINEKRTALQKHENASKAKPEHTAFENAEKAFAARSSGYAAAEKKLSEAEKAYGEAVRKKDAVLQREAENSEKARELAVLESLAPLYGKISASAAALKKIAAERADRERLHAVTAGKLENVSSERSRLSEMRERIVREFSDALPKLAERKAALERGAAASARLEKYTAALEKIRKKLLRLEAEADRLNGGKAAAEAVYDKLYGEYLSNAAAELSSRLKADCPCPVCGSLSHPKPAAQGENAVTSEDVKSARDKFETAAKACANKLAEIAAEKARIPAAEEYISAERKVMEETGYTAEELKTVSEKYAEALRQNDSLTDIDKRLGELSALKAELEKRKQSETEKLSEIKDSEVRTEAELSALRERLDPKFKDPKAYAERVNVLKKDTEEYARARELSERELASAEKRKIEDAAALSQAERERAAAEKALAETREAFLKKLEELAVLPDEYKKSLLDETAAARLAEDIKEYDLAIHAAREQVKKLSSELEGKSPPPLEKIKGEASETEAVFSELSGKVAVAAGRLERLQKLAEEYSARFAALETEREKTDKLTAFAKFMRGDKGVSFTRYVLSIMLSLVTAEANRILEDIHGGKFRLLVKTDLAANSKQGLDLEVENLTADASVRYGVKNLSGGEKFLISLALSLGLSAVARSRNGGIEIEAMFIDEGFGSLDPASLKEAVSVLCGSALGRSRIGIISHVEELKNVIPCGIEVKKRADGSSVINSGA